ncbi:MAG: Hpt domain-containing protein [Acidobacteria bacterium]|nr:Hpt domain-containing protein [Acidobacteriota bacterium]
MADPVASQISDAMNRLWQKFLPQMEERVETVQSAATRLRSGVALSDEEQSKAAAEAHKLAGVLGTFGLNEGTDLAREAEGLFEGHINTDSDASRRLIQLAERLRAIVATRS